MRCTNYVNSLSKVGLLVRAISYYIIFIDHISHSYHHVVGYIYIYTVYIYNYIYIYAHSLSHCCLSHIHNEFIIVSSLWRHWNDGECIGESTWIIRKWPHLSYFQIPDTSHNKTIKIPLDPHFLLGKWWIHVNSTMCSSTSAVDRRHMVQKSKQQNAPLVKAVPRIHGIQQ